MIGHVIVTRELGSEDRVENESLTIETHFVRCLEACLPFHEVEGYKRTPGCASHRRFAEPSSCTCPRSGSLAMSPSFPAGNFLIVPSPTHLRGIFPQRLFNFLGPSFMDVSVLCSERPLTPNNHEFPSGCRERSPREQHAGHFYSPMRTISNCHPNREYHAFILLFYVTSPYSRPDWRLPACSVFSSRPQSYSHLDVY